MPDIESLLNRWQSAGVLDAASTARIRAWESEQDHPSAHTSRSLGWQGRVALILGAILLASGVVLFISAHWDQLSPGWRYTLVIAMVALFHIAGAFTRKIFVALSTALHGVGTISAGAAIALVGQIFNIQEHWPAAVLLWAVCAVAGWILLRDEAQQTLTLLLFPAWLMSEWMFAADQYIGSEVYFGRFLIVWAVLYLTVFLGSKHKVAQGILFAASTIAAVAAIFFLLNSWSSWSSTQTYLPFHLRFWGWAEIAALPLFFALFRFSKAVIPVVAALVFGIALPWCIHSWVEYSNFGGVNRGSWSRTEPNLAAHALVAAFTVFLAWWGVRQSSRSLVNLGVVGFGAAVAWFYFSNLYDEMGRSLGLIGLGVLFLAGGWALEKTRRRLLSHMQPAGLSHQEAQ